MATVRSLNKLLDLDLAIIEDAYQAEYTARQQRSERLATIGQVAGGVAHELRNPLNVVKTSVYYLLNARNPTPEKTGRAPAADRAARRRWPTASSRPCRTSPRCRCPTCARSPSSRCVREALEINPLPDDVQVVVDCPPILPPVLADGDQLRIVFGNLIRNAREAMPQGGPADHRRPAGRTTASKWPWPTPASGSPPEDLGRIMEPLYSTKARGLGLGLASPGRSWKRTRAACAWPASRDGAAPSRSGCWPPSTGEETAVMTHRRPSDPRRGRRRGYLPQPVRHPHRPGLPGRHRPRRARPPWSWCGGDAYDVALLDLKMPGMDGLTLYREIKKLRAGTVAIMVTAYASSATAEEALAAGAWQVVAKPVDFPMLLGWSTRRSASRWSWSSMTTPTSAPTSGTCSASAASGSAWPTTRRGGRAAQGRRRSRSS